MARFKLVRTGKKRNRVEVQKVRFKVHYGALLLAFVCAVLVWLYVKGSTPIPPDISEESMPAPSASAEADTHESVENPHDDPSLTVWISVHAEGACGGRSDGYAS